MTRKNKKVEIGYETMHLPYTLPKTYVPDFTVSHSDGKVVILEAKGYLRPTDRTKLIAVKKANPHLDIRLIFAKDNKLNSRSKTRYSDWCRRHGFPYCFVNHIPNDWIHNNARPEQNGRKAQAHRRHQAGRTQGTDDVRHKQRKRHKQLRHPDQGERSTPIDHKAV